MSIDLVLSTTSFEIFHLPRAQLEEHECKQRRKVPNAPVRGFHHLPLRLGNIPTLPSQKTALAGSKGYGESWCYFNLKNYYVQLI